MSERTCTECGREVSSWPMAFRGDDQCSVLCEKAAQNKPTEVAPEKPAITMTADE